MKQIYKILISIFTILILTSSIGLAAKPTSTPTATPPNQEQIQNSRLTSLETNDTLQQMNNSEQQGLINGLINDVNSIKTQIMSLTDQLNQLLNRVTNLENVPYPAIYSNSGNWQEFKDNKSHYLENLTFVLPKDAYVTIQTDSDLLFWNGWAYTFPFVDGVQQVRAGTETGIAGQAFPMDQNLFTQWGSQVSFTNSFTMQLNAGQHTVGLLGMVYAPAPVCGCWGARTKIIVTAYDMKGNINIPDSPISQQQIVKQQQIIK